MKRSIHSTLAAMAIAIAFNGIGRAEKSLQLVPSVFDFGWVPDNAVIRCEVHVKNVGGEMIPLTAVQPSCGCTATDFTPEGLPASEEMKINLSFNTRGYTGKDFNKSVTVKAGMPEDEYIVHLKGQVVNPDAKVMPEGDGIASFTKDGDSKIIINVLNKTAIALPLKVIQEPEAWAQFKTRVDAIPANGSAGIEFRVKGSVEDSRQTSITYEAGSGTEGYRFTLVIRTGESPAPYQRIRTAPKGTSKPADPVATPGKSKKGL